jgi:hypothetical protein
MLTRSRADRRYARVRLAHDRIHCMTVEKCSKVRVLGIAPYTIDRVEGTYLVEFCPRTGRTLPFGGRKRVPVVAFEIRNPTGGGQRFPTLRAARAVAAAAAAARRQEGGDA